MTNQPVDPRIKAQYKTLSRKVNESYARRHIRPNYYRNKLAEMKAFCIENNLTNSRYLKMN